MAQQGSPSTIKAKESYFSSRTPRQSEWRYPEQTWESRLFPSDTSMQSPPEVNDLSAQANAGSTTKPTTSKFWSDSHSEVPNAATFAMPQFYPRGSELAFNKFGKGPWNPVAFDSFSEAESQLQHSHGKSGSTMPLNKFLTAILPLVKPILDSSRPEECKELDCLVEVRKWARENPGEVPRGDAEVAWAALEKEQYDWLKAAQKEAKVTARRSFSSGSSSKTASPTSIRHNSRHAHHELPSQASQSTGGGTNATRRHGAGHHRQLAPFAVADEVQHQAHTHHERHQSNSFFPSNAAMPYEQQYTFQQQQGFEQRFSPFAAIDMSYYSNPCQAVGSSSQHAGPIYHPAPQYLQAPSPVLQDRTPPQYQQAPSFDIPRPRNLPTAVWSFLNTVTPMVASIRNPRDREEMVTQWAYSHMVQVPLISSQTLNLSNDEQRLLWAAQKVLPAESRMHLVIGQ